jgi:2,3,4,5-tetrahydropyridine-2-carboxylate N-succinyltransferase
MLTPDEIEGATTRPAVDRAIAGLEQGRLRVAEPDGSGGWRVNEWLKKAVLLYFRTQDMRLVDARAAPFWDKVPARFAGFDEADFRALGARVVPGAVVRAGSHIGKDVVLMPSFVNIGAYVGEGTMVDTWATVGSRARRSASIAICPAASASVACWSRCRRRRRSSKTIASSARARKWSRASWSATTA